MGMVFLIENPAHNQFFDAHIDVESRDIEARPGFARLEKDEGPRGGS
jgi:hypothetical protein